MSIERSSVKACSNLSTAVTRERNSSRSKSWERSNFSSTVDSATPSTSGIASIKSIPPTFILFLLKRLEVFFDQFVWNFLKWIFLERHLPRRSYFVRQSGQLPPGQMPVNLP